MLGGCGDELNEFQTCFPPPSWLILFIEALVLSPNIECEGIQQRPNSKGDNQYKLS